MNKKILVFGGTSDIGFTIAKEFMLNDFDVSLIGRNEKKLSNNKLSLEKLGNGNCEILLHDFANVTDIKYDFQNIRVILINFQSYTERTSYSVNKQQRKADRDFSPNN